jgi:hypothetical protein
MRATWTAQPPNQIVADSPAHARTVARNAACNLQTVEGRPHNIPTPRAPNTRLVATAARTMAAPPGASRRERTISPCAARMRLRVMPQFGHGIPKRARNQQAAPKAWPRNQECASSAWKRKRSAPIPARSRHAAARGARPLHRSLTVAAPFRVGAATVRERWILTMFALDLTFDSAGMALWATDGDESRMTPA